MVVQLERHPLNSSGLSTEQMIAGRSLKSNTSCVPSGFVDYQHRHTGGKMVSQAAPTFQPMGKAVDAIRLARGAVKRAFDLFHALFFLPGIQAHKSRIHADFGMVVLACADFLC